MASFSLRTAVCALYSISLLTPLAAADTKDSQVLADAVGALVDSSPATGAGGETPSPTDMSVSPASNGTAQALSPTPFTSVEDATAEGQLTRALCLMFGIDGYAQNTLQARMTLRKLLSTEALDDEVKKNANFWYGLPRSQPERITSLDKVVTETLTRDAGCFDH